MYFQSNNSPNIGIELRPYIKYRFSDLREKIAERELVRIVGFTHFMLNKLIQVISGSSLSGLSGSLWMSSHVGNSAIQKLYLDISEAKNFLHLRVTGVIRQRIGQLDRSAPFFRSHPCPSIQSLHKFNQFQPFNSRGTFNRSNNLLKYPIFVCVWQNICLSSGKYLCVSGKNIRSNLARRLVQQSSHVLCLSSSDLD